MTKYKIKKSQHYDFFYLPDSLAEKEIDEIIEKQETEYGRILDFLGVENNRRIKYFLYPSKEIKNQLTGDEGNGHADREKFEIHAVYNDDIKCIGAHEDTHLLSTPLGLPPQLLREGLAEYMSEKWHDKTHDEWAVIYMNENKVPNLETLIDDEEWYELDDMPSYPIAGSFVGFLIKRYGKATLFELYENINRDMKTEINLRTFEKIMGKTLGHIETEWKNQLKN